jgi:hypothetical protein
MKKPLFFVTLVASLFLTSAAEAHSAYDGSWDIIFVTQREARATRPIISPSTSATESSHTQTSSNSTAM